MMSENSKKTGPEVESAATGAEEPVNNLSVDGLPVDDTAAGEQTEKKKSGEENTVSSPQKKRFGPWLFLLLIFIGLPLAWFFSPSEMRQQAHDVLAQFIPQTTPVQHVEQQKPTIDSTAQTTEPPVDMVQQPTATTTETVAVENAVIPDQHASAIQLSNEHSLTETDASEIENMREGLKRLQRGLAEAQSDNNYLREQMQARQKQTSGILLHLLAQPQTRLAQHAELWNAIASLPIDEERKSVALAMRDLANDNLILIKTWRQALTGLAGRIPAAVQTDILPKPENQYFAWLVGTFHLRPASSESALMQTTLKQQLLDMEHDLSLGIWPNQKKWRALIAALHDQFGADADLGLPDAELLSPALQEINLLHQTAAKWLEML